MNQPTRRKMNQLVFSIWVLSFCILLTGFIFIYCEYFRGKIPEGEKIYLHSGKCFYMKNPNKHEPPLAVYIVYSYKRKSKEWNLCRYINKNGVVKTIELHSGELYRNSSFKE